MSIGYIFKQGLSYVAKVFQADCSKCLAWCTFKLSEEDDVDVGEKPSPFQTMSKVLERVRQRRRRARSWKKASTQVRRTWPPCRRQMKRLNRRTFNQNELANDTTKLKNELLNKISQQKKELLK